MRSKQRKSLQRFLSPRILGLFFALLLCIKLLSACTNQPVELSFVVTYDELTHWQLLKYQFENKYKNIKINLVSTDQNQNGKRLYHSDQLKEIYTNAFKQKQPYDLIYMDIIWVPEFAKQEWLLDLSDQFRLNDLREKEDFLLSEVDNGLYNNKLYRIPFRTDMGVLYYRKDLLKEVNEQPPKTFDDLIRISQAVKEKRPDIKYGYLWQGQKTEGLAAMFLEVLEGYGGFWINEDKEVGLDQKKAIQAAEFLHDTIYRYKISPPDILWQDENKTRDTFLEGNAVFMRNWPFVWTKANKKDSKVRGNIGIQPMVHARGEISSACKGGWGFGIANTSKHKKEAKLAIEFFTSTASQWQFTLGYGSVPSRRKLFLEPKIVTKYSHYPKLLEMVDTKKEENKEVKYVWDKRPNIPEYAEASCILQKYLYEALNKPNGHPTPGEAMSNAAQDTRKLLATGKSNCK